MIAYDSLPAALMGKHPKYSFALGFTGLKPGTHVITLDWRDPHNPKVEEIEIRHYPGRANKSRDHQDDPYSEEDIWCLHPEQKHNANLQWRLSDMGVVPFLREGKEPTWRETAVTLANTFTNRRLAVEFLTRLNSRRALGVASKLALLDIESYVDLEVVYGDNGEPAIKVFKNPLVAHVPVKEVY